MNAWDEAPFIPEFAPFIIPGFSGWVIKTWVVRPMMTDEIGARARPLLVRHEACSSYVSSHELAFSLASLVP